MTTTPPTPTGRVQTTDAGRDLVLIRTFRSPIEDVWASITEPERTARWFASWTGEPGAGNTIRYRMTHEEGMDEDADMTIDACEPPRHLAVSAVDDYGTWRLEATLAEDGDTTVLTFVQHLDEGTDGRRQRPGLGVLPRHARRHPHGRSDPRLRRLLPRPEGVLRGLRLTRCRPCGHRAM